MRTGVEWLVQVEWEMAPAGFLSPSEKVVFEQLATPKRRRDWLLGRWTAKRLIQQMTGRNLPLTDIVIKNDPNGVPAVNLPDYSLSISHCDGWAFCAAVSRPGIALGADMEKIEPRLPTFASDYFTLAEQEQVANCPPALRPTLENSIWSSKEAVLKALHLGLSVDTRAVSCQLSGQQPESWEPFTITYHEKFLPGRDWPILSGRWRTMGQYVLTLALEQKLLGEI